MAGDRTRSELRGDDPRGVRNQNRAARESTARLLALDAQYAAELKARDEAETAAKETMRMAAHGVRGNPLFGEDSQLYRAMGFVPLSERQSGLTRKGPEAPPASGVA